MTEKLWFLKNCRVFEQLQADTLARLEAVSTTKTFAKKSPIYLPADTSQTVFLLVKGLAKICHLTPDGKQSILAFIEPGELFGELVIFGEGQRDEYAEAVEVTTVVRIPGQAMQDALGRSPAFTMGITKMIGLRRQRIERRLKNLLFLSNRDKLVHLLLELSEQYGRKSPNGIDLGIKLSHQDLANVIGSTRETVTVVLGELQSEGLIQVGRRRVTLVSLDNLASSVHVDPPSLPASPGSTPVRLS
jgi:CRP-like cAMP-binding protein